MPSGSRDGSSAAAASSAHVIARSGAPATSNRPSSGSERSASSTSSRCDGERAGLRDDGLRLLGRPRSRRPAASATRTCPRRAARPAVSEWTTRTVSNGTPRTAEAICANAVSCPCPCGDTPVSTVTVPSACTSTEPNSFDANAVIST